MRFEAPARRPRAESIVPMINVVFLLLIFFLMTAQITPPDPIEVLPPEAQAGQPVKHPLVLHVSETGEVAFRSLRGDPALTALVEETGLGPISLRVDKRLAGGELARLVATLQGAGIANIELVVTGGS